MTPCEPTSSIICVPCVAKTHSIGGSAVRWWRTVQLREFRVHELPSNWLKRSECRAVPILYHDQYAGRAP